MNRENCMFTSQVVSTGSIKMTTCLWWLFSSLLIQEKKEEFKEENDLILFQLPAYDRPKQHSQHNHVASHSHRRPCPMTRRPTSPTHRGPPNCAHWIQPLDDLLFASLQMTIRALCQQRFTEDDFRAHKKSSLKELVLKACMESVEKNFTQKRSKKASRMLASTLLMRP